MAENRGQHGLFGHKGRKNSLSGRLRGHIGSFADQVYPIYAMSKFAKTFHLEEPLGSALTCATAICRAQGKSGQWWWLYDSRSARVSSRYPVYSVHQYGMAPMCLFAVEDATGQSFREPIYKGLRWIYGDNELSVDMRDATETLIWRCILPGNPKDENLGDSDECRPTSKSRRTGALIAGSLRTEALRIWLAAVCIQQTHPSRTSSAQRLANNQTLQLVDRVTGLIC